MAVMTAFCSSVSGAFSLNPKSSFLSHTSWISVDASVGASVGGAGMSGCGTWRCRCGIGEWLPHPIILPCGVIYIGVVSRQSVADSICFFFVKIWERRY